MLHLDPNNTYTVLDDDDDDPVLLLQPGDQVVDTWREGYPYDERMNRHDYEQQKRLLQIELLKLQAHIIAKYIVRLANVPLSTVDQMSPGDLNAAGWLVAGFFLQA